MNDASNFILLYGGFLSLAILILIGLWKIIKHMAYQMAFAITKGIKDASIKEKEEGE